MTYTATDLFCGAGGSSTGLVAAGFELKLAANHSAVAITTHSANHPDAEHLCADINNVDMRRLPRTDVLWASPICTEISPAGGNRRTGRPSQLGLTDDEYEPVESAAFVRTRATAYDVIRAVEVHKYKAIMVENVSEFATDWGLFRWWFSGVEQQGYVGQIVSVSSAHVGGEVLAPAPQWRNRIYVVFTRSDIKKPDLRPRPLAWCPECAQDVHAVQSWRNGRTIGKYGMQYDYRCPRPVCQNMLVEPYVRPAAAAIDWSDLGTPISSRTRPLAAKTLARIQGGLDEYPERASLVTVNHGGHDGRTALPELAPLPSRTARVGEGLVVPHGMLVPTGGTWRTGGTALAEPMPTRTTRESDGLLTVPGSFVVTMRRNGKHAPVTKPLAAVTAGGRHHGLVIPYRKGVAKSTDEPLLTLATRDSAGLLQPGVDIDSCRFRMLQPREQLNAQAFPETYLIHGTKHEQTLQAGNAVSCNVAEWIGRRVLATL
ncbi:DNA cytosine methyltransferase [Streptomyces sp. NBC_01568]|uniref:DNA cytosine methyltransferase n=1 Tax=Streptomyces sp. NBC_01568 TaxID=2975882 RepID=UPI002F907FFF